MSGNLGLNVLIRCRVRDIKTFLERKKNAMKNQRALEFTYFAESFTHFNYAVVMG